MPHTQLLTVRVTATAEQMVGHVLTDLGDDRNQPDHCAHITKVNGPSSTPFTQNRLPIWTCK